MNSFQLKHSPAAMSTKSVQAVSKQKTDTKYAKSDSRYWTPRLFRSSYTRDGIALEVADYCIKIAYGGRRETINLRTPNQATASSKAAALYKQLVSEGWDAVLAIHKPKATKPVRSATVGELLAEIKATAGIRDSTFTVYAQSLRQIVSEIADIGDQPALDEHGNPKRDRRNRIVYLPRRDHYKGGREAWLAKVEAQSLDILTADAVQRWKLAYIAKAGTAPDAARRATNTATTLLRCARSLFSAKSLEYVQKTLTLPNPLPFTGVKLEKRPATRYMRSWTHRRSSPRPARNSPASRSRFSSLGCSQGSANARLIPCYGSRWISSPAKSASKQPPTSSPNPKTRLAPWISTPRRSPCCGNGKPPTKANS